jgi:outer membrane protein OmpA-like peptidoglycan-associated protein
MRRMHDARVRIIVLLAAVMTWPSAAFADAISIRLTTSVSAGQAPKLTIVANQAVEKIEVLLSRDDGKDVQQSIASLAAGASQDIALDGAPGRHSYTGRITCGAGDKRLTSQVSFETVVGGVMKVVLDKSHVDLAHGRLDMLVSIPEGTVMLKILSATDNAVLVEREESFSDHEASAPLVVTWDPPGKDAEIGRVDVRVSDPGGAYQSYSLFPWTVYIPHEEVNFATDSAAIAVSEAPKLQASLAKITDALAKHKELGAITLYIAGHTDTVGSAKYNLGLSQKRAQAIAGWFRKNGLTLPIAYEGFGEQALRIATPDNTDEPRNRRVDYILSVEDPVLRATDFRPAWKPVK